LLNSRSTLSDSTASTVRLFFIFLSTMVSLQWPNQADEVGCFGGVSDGGTGLERESGASPYLDGEQ
jgi:hypothetical protein